MKMKTIRKYAPAALAVLAIAMVVLMPAMGLASGGEEGGQEHGSPWPGFFWKVVNFCILIGAILYFARKPIADFFRGRSEAIAESIEEAREVRERSEKALAEIKAQLASLEKDVANIVATSVSAGERERERLSADGERLSKNIVEQAKVGIEMELKQAQEALRAEAVYYAIELAEQKLAGRLTGDAQKKVFEDALQRLKERS